MNGAALALLAAALFGASAPIAKRLLGEIAPPLLAALLYLGAGLFALPFFVRAARRREAPLGRADLPLLAGVVLTGGVAAPLLLLYGLAATSAGLASLLLNLEVVFTTLVAVIVFGESIGRRGVAALVVLVAGCALAGTSGGGGGRALLGPLAVAGACLLWAVDNNLTARLSLRDPVAVVCIKGFGAAPLALALAKLSGSMWPSLKVVAGALLLGSVAYGVSLTLYVRAARALGAARTGLYFAVAPFFGALLALPINRESPSWRLGAAGALLAAGVGLLFTERHAHAHVHEPLLHDHLHTHDEHHQHAHRGDEGPEPHSHPHEHEPLEHEHPHASDAHHRHKH